jgi:hypothetical protein
MPAAGYIHGNYDRILLRQHFRLGECRPQKMKAGR